MPVSEGLCPVKGLAVDGILAFRHRDGIAKDGGDLAVLEIMHRVAAGARNRHILALDIGDGATILVVIAILDVPAQVGGFVRLKGDTAGVAGDRDGPNVTDNLSNSSHNNLRPFKGE